MAHGFGAVFGQLADLYGRAFYKEHSFRIVLMFLAALVIIGMYSDRRVRAVLVWPSVVIVLCVYSLPTAWIMQNGSGAGEKILSYGSRFPLVLPWIIVVALGAVLLTGLFREGDKRRSVAAILLVFIIIFNGESAFAPDGLGDPTGLGIGQVFGGWNIPQNPYKIDPETLDVAEIIMDDAGWEERERQPYPVVANDRRIYVRCPKQIGDDIRIYDANFCIYRRHGDKESWFTGDRETIRELVKRTYLWRGSRDLYFVYPHIEEKDDEIKEAFKGKSCEYLGASDSGKYDIFVHRGKWTAKIKRSMK